MSLSHGPKRLGEAPIDLGPNLYLSAVHELIEAIEESDYLTEDANAWQGAQRPRRRRLHPGMIGSVTHLRWQRVVDGIARVRELELINVKDEAK